MGHGVFDWIGDIIEGTTKYQLEQTKLPWYRKDTFWFDVKVAFWLIVIMSLTLGIPFGIGYYIGQLP